MSKSITEKELVPNASYQALYSAGENEEGTRMIVRNTTVSRLQFRLNGDNDDTFTVSPGEKFTVPIGIAARGKLIEVKTVTDIASSVRLNMIG